MVRASARFLLFTRSAVIIEIWGRHDIEPTLRKSTNPVLHQLGILCIMPITAPFALPLGYGCNLEKYIALTGKQARLFVSLVLFSPTPVIKKMIIVSIQCSFEASKPV